MAGGDPTAPERPEGFEQRAQGAARRGAAPPCTELCRVSFSMTRILHAHVGGPESFSSAKDELAGRVRNKADARYKVVTGQLGPGDTLANHSVDTRRVVPEDKRHLDPKTKRQVLLRHDTWEQIGLESTRKRTLDGISRLRNVSGNMNLRVGTKQGTQATQVQVQIQR